MTEEVFCDWRERVQAEAQRGARHILCVITGLVGATQSRADRGGVGKANGGLWSRGRLVSLCFIRTDGDPS